MLGGVIGRAQKIFKIIQNYFHTALRIPFLCSSFCYTTMTKDTISATFIELIRRADYYASMERYRSYEDGYRLALEREEDLSASL